MGQVGAGAVGPVGGLQSLPYAVAADTDVSAS
jgi:hypothetical protein